MEIWGTIISFAIILIVTNRTNNLWGALLLGSLTMGILSGLDLSQLAAITWRALTDPMTLELTAIIIMIGVLGKIMKDVGMLQQMVVALSKLVSDVRRILVLVAGILGMIPVPGGAALSAPLIDEAGDRLGLDIHDKAAVNLYFRHIWNNVFPLFPALIIAESISGISIYRFIMMQIPAVLVGLVVGYWVLLSGKKAVTSGRKTANMTQEESAASVDLQSQGEALTTSKINKA